MGPQPAPAEQDVIAAKARLRRELRGTRGTVTQLQRSALTAAITAHLRALPELGTDGLVLAYAATGTEVSLEAWLRDRLAAGGGVVLPWVEGNRLRLARVMDLDRDLEPGWRGVREPVPVLRAAPLPAGVLVAAVVPGLGFDIRGGRLGQGGGHVDRLLAGLAEGVPVVAPAFAVQVVAALPQESHDRAVDVLVTEHGVIRCG